LEFIRARAESMGAEIWLEDNQLFVRSRTHWGTSPALTLTYGAGLLRFSVLADLTTQASELHVSGWNVAQKTDFDQQAAALPATLTPNNGQTGGNILAQAFGEQPARVVHTAPVNAEAADQYAQARFEAQARRFITGTGIAVAEPELRIGQVVALEGLGERHSGLYYCVGVRHRFDTTHGYRIEFDVERADFAPGEARRPPISRPGSRRPPSKRPNMGKKE
ncbi:MAG: phage late control D family protein, partial [Anaerolineae bacterium]|nr:phage late control D family protein [Anaerolineae bacterium]